MLLLRRRQRRLGAGEACGELLHETLLLFRVFLVRRQRCTKELCSHADDLRLLLEAGFRETWETMREHCGDHADGGRIRARRMRERLHHSAAFRCSTVGRRPPWLPASLLRNRAGSWRRGGTLRSHGEREWNRVSHTSGARQRWTG